MQRDTDDYCFLPSDPATWTHYPAWYCLVGAFVAFINLLVAFVLGCTWPQGLLLGVDGVGGLRLHLLNVNPVQSHFEAPPLDLSQCLAPLSLLILSHQLPIPPSLS